MLWFDNSNIPLATKIKNAVDYYQAKYGRKPNVCLVNPQALEAGQEVPEIAIRPYHSVLPGHLLIGVEDEAVSEELTFLPQT